MRSAAIWLFLLLAWPAGAWDCRFLYKEMVPAGSPWTPVTGTLEKTTPEGDFYVLGKGSAGGTVYRVIPKDPAAPSYLLKRYGSKAQCEQDTLLLQDMAAASGKQPAFRIPVVKRLAEDTLRLEDTPGRDLHSILVDPKVDQNIKERLRAAYVEKLDSFATALRLNQRISSRQEVPIRDHFKDGKLDGTMVLTGSWPSADGRPISFLVKSDNIIVHWVGGTEPFVMTLVDPY